MTENNNQHTMKQNKNTIRNVLNNISKWIKRHWFYISLIIAIVVFCLFNTFLENNNQTLMIMITAIYVIATIKISNANIESAEATRAQLAKTIEQHNDSKHLQILPFLQASFSNKKTHDYTIELPCSEDDKEDDIIISIENIGKGSANNITYTWRYGGSESTGGLGMVGIREGVLYDIKVSFKGNRTTPGDSGSLILHYSDILGKKYKQNVIISFLDGFQDMDVQVCTEVPTPE